MMTPRHLITALVVAAGLFALAAGLLLLRGGGDASTLARPQPSALDVVALSPPSPSAENTVEDPARAAAGLIPAEQTVSNAVAAFESRRTPRVHESAVANEATQGKAATTTVTEDPLTNPTPSAAAELLQGDALTAAIASAIEAGDLGALQGLLISGLTLGGTRLAAADLPLLAQSLGEVEDYGLQKLLLTHLERLEAPASEKVATYLDYLEKSPRPVNAEEVFGQLTVLKGEAAVQGLSALLEQSGREQLHSGAAKALGEIGDLRGVPAIEAALRRATDARGAEPRPSHWRWPGSAERRPSPVW